MTPYVPLWWKSGVHDYGTTLRHLGQRIKFEFHRDSDLRITAFESLVETAPV